MMKQFLIFFGFLIISSCIPLRIAPKINNNKVMLAKKFKRNLPRDYAFIFKDPKDADEFYDFINAKYALDNQIVQWNVPFTIESNEYFLSFYETEIPTKTINLVPLIVDISLVNNGYDPLFVGAEFSRVGNWYLALTVSDAAMNDCLAPNYKYRDKVVKYLRNLRTEYLNTHNYL